MANVRNCDVIFNIGGENIQAGMTFQPDENIDLDIIADYISTMSDLKKLELRLKIKNTKSIYKYSDKDFDDFKKYGTLIPNATVYTISNMFPEYNWDGLDHSVKVLAVSKLDYNGLNLGLGGRIVLDGQEFYVVDVNNSDSVRKLRTALYLESRLDNPDDSLNEILSRSAIDILVNLDSIKDFKNSLAVKLQYYNDLKLQAENYRIKSEELENEYNDVIQKVDNKELLSDEEKKLYSEYKKEIKELSSEFSNDDMFLYKLLSDEMSGISDLLDSGIPSNPIEMIRDYIRYPDKYSSIIIKNISASSVLQDIVNQLKGNESKFVYNDSLLNNINVKLDFDKKTKESSITKLNLFTALNIKLNYVSDEIEQILSELNNTSDEERKDGLREDLDNLNKIFDKLDTAIDAINKNNDSDLLKAMLDILEDADIDFTYQIERIQKNAIYFKNVPANVENKYPDLCGTKEIPKFEGKQNDNNIYSFVLNGKRYYVSTTDIMTGKSYTSRRRQTYADAVNDAKKKFKERNVYKTSYYELMLFKDDTFIRMPNYLEQGLIVEVLDLDLNKQTLLNRDELNLLMKESSLVSKVIEYIEGLIYNNFPEHESELAIKEIIPQLDSTLKLVAFIHLIAESCNNTERNNISKDTFYNVLSKVSEAKTKRYMVEHQRTGFADKKSNRKYYKRVYKYDLESRSMKWSDVQMKTYDTRFIEINENDITESTSITSKQPLIRVLTSLCETLKAKFNLDYKLITNETLNDDEVYNKEIFTPNTKAFIRDGIVYLNVSNCSTSDLFHEYTHIILGILRQTNPKNYQRLVTVVTDKVKSTLLDKYREDYPNLSEIDLREEVFADLFGDYLANRSVNPLVSSDLEEMKKLAQGKLLSVFNTEPLDTASLADVSISELMNRFTNDLSIQFSNSTNGLEINMDVLKLQRKFKNWLSEKIAKYNKAEKEWREESDPKKKEMLKKNMESQGIREQCV